MEKAIQDRFDYYTELLEEVLGPNRKPCPVHPYQWKVGTRVEPLTYLETITFDGDDITDLNGQSREEQLNCLRAKFGYLAG